MLGIFGAVCIGGLCGLSISTDKARLEPSLPASLQVPALESSHPLSISSCPPFSPVKRMTKDLSYAGSKNQNFLLASSFVASQTPCPPNPVPGPRLEAVPPLKLLF